MKIYFSAAIFQKDKFGKNYEKIVRILRELGHEVFQDTTQVSLKAAIEKTDKERVRYYKQVLKWIAKSDLIVLEVSFPSTLHIGHEISLAMEKNKPVIALYQKGYEPSFFLGLESDKLIWVEYELKILEEVLTTTIALASEKSDTRFNFFISKKIANYLDWIAKKRRIPRAVYLRQLITREMKKYSEFR